MVALNTSIVGKFRKKPVLIDAIQWLGNNLKEVIEFTGLNESAKKWSWEQYEKVVAEDGLKIFTSVSYTHLTLPTNREV